MPNIRISLFLVNMPIICGTNRELGYPGGTSKGKRGGYKAGAS